MNLSVTDILALTRTRLANERTLLAYLRTFLSFIVAGVSMIQFFQVPAFIVLGYCLIPIGVVILFAGARRYNRTERKLQALGNNKVSEPAVH